MPRRRETFLFAALLFLGLVVSIRPPVVEGSHLPSHFPTLAVSPHSQALPGGNTSNVFGIVNFTVSVSGISSGTGLENFAFRLTFDNQILGLDTCVESEGVASLDPCDSASEVAFDSEIAGRGRVVWLLSAQNATVGEVAVNATMLEPLTRPGPLLKIPFAVLRQGHSVMGLRDAHVSFLSPTDFRLVEFRHLDVDGYFQNDGTSRADVGVSVVAFWTNNTMRGVPVVVTVGFENEGSGTVSFSLEVKVNATNTNPRTRSVGSASGISLAAGESRVLNFTWVTAPLPQDTYLVWAKTSPTDADSSDNVGRAPGLYGLGAAMVDVGVGGFDLTPASLTAGFPVILRIEASNLGARNETVTVRTWANSTLIDQRLGLSLSILQSENITFLWNTTMLPAGNYVITAQLVPVPGENSLSNNNSTLIVRVNSPSGGSLQAATADYTWYYVGGGVGAAAVVVGLFFFRRRRV